jgi:hypothetical protein
MTITNQLKNNNMEKIKQAAIYTLLIVFVKCKNRHAFFLGGGAVMCLRGRGSLFWVRLTPAHPAHPKIARAQGGITPGPIGGELDADFPNLGRMHEF